MSANKLIPTSSFEQIERLVYFEENTDDIEQSSPGNCRPSIPSNLAELKETEDFTPKVASKRPVKEPQPIKCEFELQKSGIASKVKACLFPNQQHKSNEGIDSLEDKIQEIGKRIDSLLNQEQKIEPKKNLFQLKLPEKDSLSNLKILPVASKKLEKKRVSTIKTMEKVFQEYNYTMEPIELFSPVRKKSTPASCKSMKSTSRDSLKNNRCSSPSNSSHKGALAKPRSSLPSKVSQSLVDLIKKREEARYSVGSQNQRNNISGKKAFEK